MKCIPPYRSSRAASAKVLFLGALYLLLSVGILKATHYCQGNEASIAYFTADSEGCVCAKPDEKNEDLCCDDKRDLLKLEVSQKVYAAFEISPPALLFLGEVYTQSLTSDGKRSEVFSPVTEDDRRPPKALFEFHCSFVFYDAESIS